MVIIKKKAVSLGVGGHYMLTLCVCVCVCNPKEFHFDELCELWQIAMSWVIYRFSDTVFLDPCYSDFVVLKCSHYAKSVDCFYIGVVICSVDRTVYLCLCICVILFCGSSVGSGRMSSDVNHLVGCWFFTVYLKF